MKVSIAKINHNLFDSKCHKDASKDVYSIEASTMMDTKLVQYLYGHPYLLDDAFVISLTEANKWAKDNDLSALDVIAFAKEKYLSIPPETWAIFERTAKTNV